MAAEPLTWTDRKGVRHVLRHVLDIPADQFALFKKLHQRIKQNTELMHAGFFPPNVDNALPNMMRSMLHILLPTVDTEEISTIDIIEGTNLLIRWWDSETADDFHTPPAA